MNKPAIIALIVAGSLILVGLILSVIGLAVNNFAPPQLVTTPAEAKSYTVPVDDLTAISAESALRAIKVVPSPDDKVRITYFESSVEHYTVTHADGQLTLDYQEDRRLFPISLFNFDLRREPVMIEIPATYTGTLEVETSNATLTVSDLTALKSLEAVTSNATIKVRHLAVSDSMRIKSSNGSLTLDQLVSGMLEAETSNSRITATEVQSSQVDFKTSNSAIEFTGLKADRISLITSNSRISGTIAGQIDEYQIDSDTSNGDNSLTNLGGSGPKTLIAKTSNSDIDVHFVS